MPSFRPKPREEFAGKGAPDPGFVFTVCDRAAQEAGPVWSGQPMTAHWGIPDPASVEGPEAERRYVFANTCRMLRQRIAIFVNLRIPQQNSLSLQKEDDETGTLSRVVGEDP